MVKKTKIRKIASVILSVAIFATMVLPSMVFAAVTTPTAVATVTEKAGGGQSKTITVKFNEEVVVEEGAALDTDISVSGKTFASSEYKLDPDTQKDLVITLSDDATVSVGDSITFSNNKVYDAGSPTDYFNDSVEITGSLETATIDYSSITPAEATVEIDGYSEKPVNVGTGVFHYEVSMENYQTKTGDLTVTDSDLGKTVKLEVALEENPANYEGLNAKVSSVEAEYLSADYTPTSYAVLKSALDNAKAVDKNLKVSQQGIIDNLISEIDEAIAQLVPMKEVTFMAVAVADDASVNYAKATKIVLVFAEPVEAGADILSGLSIKESVSSAKWLDDENTIYELTLNADAALENGLEITYIMQETVKTKLGTVLNTTKAIVAGNLEEAAGYVTATNMAATVVKASTKPGVNSGDKIVLVFNAPVKNNPAQIDVTVGEVSLKANVLAETSYTVYEISLNGDETVVDGVEISYNTTIKTTLKGTFGKAAVARALKAMAVDNDGTALVANDEIVVVFDQPTNGADITEKLSTPGILTGIAGASFGSNSKAVWTDNNTRLVIIIGDTATVSNGIKINLSGLGIKHQYDMVDAEIGELSVEGSFGYTIQPRITKAVAFTQNDMDYIRVFFNTEVKAKMGETVDVTISGFTMGASATKNLVDQNNGLTYYEIIMAKDEHSAFESGKYEISLVGIVDKETGTKELSPSPVKITGAFISPITPEVLKAVAISNDGSGTAKPGDKIVAVFNTEVTIGSVTASDGYFGTGYSVNYSVASKNVVEIILGDAGLDVKPGTTQITFSGFKDEATESVTMEDTTETVSGSFGYSEIPEIMSATAVSADGSGISKTGDKIVIVFNTMITYNGSDIYYYEYVLNKDGEYKVGDTFTITVASKATGEIYELSKEIGGSFGYSQMPSVKSVVLSENDGAETITVVFDRATNKSGIDTSILYDNNKHLGQGVAAAWTDAYVLKISLAATASTTNDDVLNLTGLGIKAADTNEEITNIDALPITGTLIPIVKTVEASGKSIVITFSARTNGVANISNLSTLLGIGAKAQWSDNNTVLTITLGNNYTITNNGYIVLNGMGIYDAFSGQYHVVGQYKISGSIETEKLAVTKIVAQSTDKSKTEAQKGDTIVVKFNSATDLNGSELNQIMDAAAVNSVISVEGGNEAMLGTGYTGEWTAYDTLVITLGGKTIDESKEPSEKVGNDPAITVGTAVTVSGVSFANGEGTMDSTSMPLSGSFNGREFVVTDGSVTRTSGKTGDYRISLKVEDTMLNTTIVPTVVCVAFDKNTPVGVMRISIDVEDTIQPVFEFSGNLTITNAKIYVFSDIFGNITESPDVLAEAYEIEEVK